MADFKELLGKTLTEMSAHGYSEDEIRFVCSDGSRFVMRHDQNCCECAPIEDIRGDIADLIGAPLIRAEEMPTDGDPDGWIPIDEDSFIWTFYKLATIKGSVEIKWHGTSNGHSSESVNFTKMEGDDG